jgi:hypothetical protein
LKYVLCAIPLLMVTTCGVWRLAPATFTLKNGSGQPIRSLTIEVAGKTFRYQDIPPGGTVSGSFRVQQEESLLIEGRLADGTGFAESHDDIDVGRLRPPHRCHRETRRPGR